MKPRRFIFFPSFQPVFEYKILRTKRAMKKQEIDDVFDEHKEIYLFSQTSVQIQLIDTKGVKKRLKNRKSTQASMRSRRFIFFPSFQPVFNSTSNLDTERVSSYYGYRYQAVNLVDLLSRPSNITDSTHSCHNFTNKLDTKCVSSYYGCRYQAVNLVDLLSRPSNIIDSTPFCRNFTNNLDTKHISSY